MKNLGNIVIFGDSYSTFKGCIPEGYAYYYNPEGEPSSSGRPCTDVRSASDMWWAKLLNKCHGRIVLNNSWSGSTVCNTGYGSCGIKDCTYNSFITRVDELIKNDFFLINRIDTIFIFGLTNDCWVGAPVGKPKFSDWCKEDLFCVLPAFAYLMSRLKNSIQDIKVYFILNDGLSEEISSGAQEICEQLKIDCLSLESIDKQYNHPTIKGMSEIAEQIYRGL